MSWFGIKPPEGVATKARYGCRAILHSRRRHIDLVWDRKQAEPQPLPPEFAVWLNTRLTDWLAAYCDQKFIDPAGHVEFVLTEAPFHAVASAKGSHGYLYVGAWMEDKP